jgi:Domain of unknown function (DUF4395)
VLGGVEGEHDVSPALSNPAALRRPLCSVRAGTPAVQLLEDQRRRHAVSTADLQHVVGRAQPELGDDHANRADGSRFMALIVARPGDDAKVDYIGRLFRFPNPVNEIAARVVAAGVVVMALLILLLGWTWVLVPLAYGFVARVAAGPTFSPLGRLATRVVVPALPIAPRPVDGPPKRFAQAIGATLSVAALIAHFAFGATAVALVLVALVALAATLESAFAICVGCKLFALLIRHGVIPASVCAACSDLSLRHPRPAT